MRIDVDRGRRIDRLAQDLEGDPQAGIARQGERMQAEVEILLDAGGVDDRDGRCDQGGLALVRRGRRLGHVVVAREGDDAAVLGGAGIVGVLQHVARAIDARALAVPHAEHAVVARAGIEMDLLGAPQRGGGEVLVDARLEFDVVVLDEALGLPQRLVEAAQRRAAVARDVARRVEARCQVTLALHHRQAHQGLRSGQVDPSAFKDVFVVQGHRDWQGNLPDTHSQLSLSFRFLSPWRGERGLTSETVATESCGLQSVTSSLSQKDAFQWRIGLRPPRRFKVSAGNETL